ncbi:hypothetical protein BANRA_05771 [Escherichia coli]|nr:hypothetical protein BANRA_05771 [Escherichia coli]
MKEKRNDAELKNRKTKRDYDYERRVSDIYFDLFFVFVAAGTFLWVIMHSIFDACIDSWKADPELNNFRYMWNILMYVIPYTLWAFAGGFLIVYVRNPLNELINGGIRIFRLKRRMRREKKLREGGQCFALNLFWFFVPLCDGHTAASADVRHESVL